MEAIRVDHLVKEFTVVKKQQGIRGAIKSLVQNEKKLVRAVDDISFSINSGEIVGYIGPNGSGKSTTIKMMSGIMKPTSGNVTVNGISPQKDRKAVVRDLGVVFGQRTQLYWDLRLGESFELFKRIYQIPSQVYDRNMEMVQDIFKIDEIMDTPVRQLSLGQRMKGDLVAAVLHSPSTLFLDEPTIGLDLDAKQAIRNFVKDINRECGTNVILTTHDLGDIQELCSRIVVINKGKIIEDGSLNGIIGKIAPIRRLVVDFFDSPDHIIHSKARVVKSEGSKVWLEFEKEQITAAELISDISGRHAIRDLAVEEADIEDIIRHVYRG